jgi:hypothetical protein
MDKASNITAVMLFVVFLFVGCAGPSVYEEIFRETPRYNSKEFSVSKDVLYEATARAICVKNFIIEKEDKENGFILAKRSFQKGKRTIILALQAKMTSKEKDKSMLYLNTLQTTERLFVADRTRFFLFIIPLPGGGGKEASKIKEGEKIIEDKEFYHNFFSAIESEIRLPSEQQE